MTKRQIKFALRIVDDVHRVMASASVPGRLVVINSSLAHVGAALWRMDVDLPWYAPGGHEHPYVAVRPAAGS